MKSNMILHFLRLRFFPYSFSFKHHHHCSRSASSPLGVVDVAQISQQALVLLQKVDAVARLARDESQLGEEQTRVIEGLVLLDGRRLAMLLGPPTASDIPVVVKSFL